MTVRSDVAFRLTETGHIAEHPMLLSGALHLCLVLHDQCLARQRGCLRVALHALANVQCKATCISTLLMQP